MNRIILLLILVLFSTNSAVYSQDTLRQRYIFSTELGIGIGRTFQILAYALNGHFQIQFDNHIVASQVLFSQELASGSGDAITSPLNQVFVITLLYGRAYSFRFSRGLTPFFPLSLLVKENGKYRISGSIGLSYNKNVKRGKETNWAPPDREPFLTYAEERNESLGFPIQLELTKEVTPSIGFVHRIYYNYTRQSTSWGMLWALEFCF